MHDYIRLVLCDVILLIVQFPQWIDIVINYTGFSTQAGIFAVRILPAGFISGAIVL